jgi:hypothetical protein
MLLPTRESEIGPVTQEYVITELGCVPQMLIMQRVKSVGLVII